jgi:quercetin dioxygenase-like cupin family protein
MRGNDMDLARPMKIAALATAVALTPLLVSAQPVAAPAQDYKAFLPNPANIPFTLPDNIPWTGAPGRQQQYKILGDPSKPGPYILLMKWWPGSYSKPHMHEKVRYITVVSGTWWVSSSNTYDPTKTYPLPAGSVVRDEPNTVHWDGAKDVPTVLEIVGEGPVSNINVDEQGRVLPPRPRAAGAEREN